MKSTTHAGRSAGFTLVEILIAVALLAVALSSVQTVFQTLAGTFRAGSARMEIDTQGGRAVRRFVEALRNAEVGSLAGVPASPLFSSQVDYRCSEGFDGGTTVWSDTQRIRYVPAERTVEWIERLGLPDQVVVFRCRDVAALLEGETANGLDDNGNGLIDEPGFCLELEGSLLTVRLTLLGEDHQGRPIQRTWTNSVRCRN